VSVAAGGEGRGGDALGKSGRAQYAVGLDNLFQTLFGAPIAAVSVRMEPLYQFLIPRLYLLQGRGGLEIKHLEGLQLYTRKLANRAADFFLDLSEHGELVFEVLPIARTRRTAA